MLDTAYHVATPEGIELRLRVAGPAPRALAWLIDFAWRMGALIALAIVVTPLGDIGFGVFLLAWFALEWLVPAWLEARPGGATPGKRALGLMVVRDDGAPVTLAPALARNLLRFADFLPFAYLGGLLAMLSNGQFKRLGDFVAGTLVVHADPAQVARQIPRAEPAIPPLPLSADEARTVLDFAERVPYLGAERAAELAAIAAPLLRADLGTPVQQLTAMANHLVGRAPD
jgi:uncharacterized RDD family membrane protein YckC